jgi:hypothetical protein
MNDTEFWIDNELANRIFNALLSHIDFMTSLKTRKSQISLKYHLNPKTMRYQFFSFVNSEKIQKISDCEHQR